MRVQSSLDRCRNLRSHIPEPSWAWAFYALRHHLMYPLVVCTTLLIIWLALVTICEWECFGVSIFQGRWSTCVPEVFQIFHEVCVPCKEKRRKTRLGVPSIAGRLLKVIETCVYDLSLQTHTPLHYILGLSSQTLTPAKRWQNFEIWSRGTSCSNRCLWSLSNSTRFKKNS